MKKILYIVFAVALTACSTANGIPIDDAYYSPDIEKGNLPTPSSPMIQNTQNTQNTQTATKQSIEYLNVQDTTVTIRIK